MASFYLSSCDNHFQKTLSFLYMVLSLFLLLINNANSVFFNFTSFQPNMNSITFQGDAFANGVLQLTKNQLDQSIASSAGRASYTEPVLLWDQKSGKLTDFTTHFSFVRKVVDPTRFADGLSFFIPQFQSEILNNYTGGFLALLSPESAFDTTKNQIVAVEFDRFRNDWDPSDDHASINVNSIQSVSNVTWKGSIKDGRTANAWVKYDSTTKNPSVFLTYANQLVFIDNSSLSRVIDLKQVLQERVRVGFSTATGDWIELHNILSWSFNSSLEDN